MYLYILLINVSSAKSDLLWSLKKFDNSVRKGHYFLALLSGLTPFLVHCSRGNITFYMTHFIKFHPRVCHTFAYYVKVCVGTWLIANSIKRAKFTCHDSKRDYGSIARMTTQRYDVAGESCVAWVKLGITLFPSSLRLLVVPARNPPCLPLFALEASGANSARITCCLSWIEATVNSAVCRLREANSRCHAAQRTTSSCISTCQSIVWSDRIVKAVENENMLEN